jgi:type II secretory pathway pseudopilin PulG
MQEKTSPSFVQILITAIILGMVARSVGPLFTRAGSDRRVCSLINGLETMRNAIDLYRAHHKGELPPCGSFESFEAAITTKAGRYRPSLNGIPVNPFNGLNTVRFDGEPAGSGRAGWRLDTNSRCFQADSDTAHAGL